MLKGVPLEDVPLSGGAFVHWEARVMGPEVMSYGSFSGEVYVSDITLAYLEDTGTYPAYSLAIILSAFAELSCFQPSHRAIPSELRDGGPTAGCKPSSR